LKYPVSIIYPTDPFGPGISGIKTFIGGFIKYAPLDFKIELIGIISGRGICPIKKWTKLKLAKTKFDFFPLLREIDENKKTTIPLSLRFTIALKTSNLEFKRRLLFFHRIEPAIIFKRVKAPKIAIIHSNVLKQLEKGKSKIKWNYFPWLYFVIENFIFGYFDAIYTVSKDLHKFYQRRYKDQNGKFIFLPNYVDTEIFFPKYGLKNEIKKNLVKMDKYLPLKKKWVLHVGRLHKEKAPLRLVHTFAIHNRTDKDSVLIMIGEGNLEPKINEFISKSGLKDSIYLLRRKSQIELAEFYRASDAFLLTSNYEGMPICVLEALACGLPVVSTDVGGVNEVVKNGISGEIVKSFSPYEISKSLKRVLESPLIYSKNNCINAISKFTPQKVLIPLFKKIRDIYNNFYKIYKL